MKTINKYVLASSLAAIMTVTLFGGYSIKQYQANEVQEEHEKLETCIRTFWELLTHKGADFRVVNGKLLAGTYKVNGNFELPDKVQEIFGGVATIFMGDERVSTNVLNSEGRRAMGTRLVGPAYDAVFKQGKPYRGMVDILGIPYLTAYDPIRDRNREVIGVLFVGIKESEFQARLSALKINLNLALLATVTVFTCFMLMLWRAMKRYEDANENHIRFQQTLVDTIPNPVFYKDAACRYLGCNKAFEVYAGMSQDDLIGKTPHEIWPKELADRYRQQDMALLGNPGVQAYEATVRCADGTLRDVIFNKATFNERDGSVRGLVGVILDITERKQAEDAVAFQNVLLSTQQEASIDGILVVDENGKILSFNHRFVEIMDIPSDLLETRVDEPVLKYVTGRVSDPRRFIEKVNYLYEHRQEICRDEISLCDGKTLDRYTVPLLDADGRYYGRLWSFRDITEYRLAELEKLRLESQLEHSRLMETVMNRLGHDLKTPLTPLFILLPLLKNRLTEPDMVKRVEMCIQSTIAIKNLADKAGILSHLSFTIKPHELESASLAAIANQALADCMDMISGKEIDCRISVDPAIIVHVVPAQIREVFNNLISNAVHFSPEKSVVVISAVSNGETVVVSVRDEGVGLALVHLNHIFDEFFKADESRHDLNTNGLGLSICKRIVQNHHGRIWGESPGIGKGTTIRFTINEQNADYTSDDYSI